MMTPSVVWAAWLAALRGNEYVQGRGRMYNRNPEESYCCLGVLMRVLEKLRVPVELVEPDQYMFGCGFSMCGDAPVELLLPRGALSFLGLRPEDSRVRREDCEDRGETQRPVYTLLGKPAGWRWGVQVSSLNDGSMVARGSYTFKAITDALEAMFAAEIGGAADTPEFMGFIEDMMSWEEEEDEGGNPPIN